jgi:hypothetical protein
MLYDLKQESPIGKWQRCWKRRLLDWIAWQFLWRV